MRCDPTWRRARRAGQLAALCIVLLAAGCGRSDDTAGSDAPTPTPSMYATPGASAETTPAETFAPEEPPAPEPPSDDELVRVADYIPGIFVELRYATADNFTGSVVYDFQDARLRYGTVKKLAAAQAALLEQGCSLKIWDAYRPVSAQYALWALCPDARYVANPNTGFSSHSRGNTVDVTLVSADGTELEMPSGFDEFSALADRDYSDVSETARRHAELLEQIMAACGFVPYSAEWWHYADEAVYDVVWEPAEAA